ncbi:hypothetical protein P168DRAFT_6147 [Aspergillus campestris IBT 28561]|uniref:Uncharacterized protein n=1 Tax=Aspergillus campestris (strain IBT 28561) TaxID=1392248 RepID=A0A2I1DDR5_ASPC2|nr:uncharacterized protein P168DRAFT_6147 [Aspergillus campestris IBT 28561]PKY07996.1 hypothetical protein P168DRAFT_6147 [Aspergillus campestris IBT 28561]
MPHLDTWNIGYGSRHYADIAPFSLWDGDSSTFRPPAAHESQWIFDTFSAVSVNFFWPRIIIETATPPSPTPLTIACVAAIFIPVGSKYTPPITNTNYSNHRMADPIPAHFHWPKWQRPTKEQSRVVWERLGQIMNIEAVNFIPPIIIIELRHDEREYSKRSLPGKVAGRIAVYHRGPPSFWETIPHTRERLIKSSDALQDTYFQAHEPKRLLRSTEILDNIWCTVDGLASGLVYLRTDGVRLRRAPRLPVPESRTEYIFEYIEGGAHVAEGVRGVPIVIDHDNDNQLGAVVGFFQQEGHGSRWILSSCLDDVIEGDWDLL